MAYDVKYIGEKEEIKPYLDNREDRIESEFNSLDGRVSKISGMTPISITVHNGGNTIVTKYPNRYMVIETKENIKWSSPNSLSNTGLYYRSEVYSNYVEGFASHPIVTGLSLEVGNTIVWTQLRSVGLSQLAFATISPFQYSSDRDGVVHYSVIGKY